MEIHDYVSGEVRRASLRDTAEREHYVLVGYAVFVEWCTVNEIASLCDVNIKIDFYFHCNLSICW